MAEATRMKDIQDELKNQGSDIQRLLKRFEIQRDYNAQKEAENQHRFDQIQATLERLLLEKSTHQQHEESTANTSATTINVVFPIWNFSLDWIFKAEQFFNYHGTPDMARVEIAAMHFKESQFGPSPFDCPIAQLFKLQQTGPVSDYYLHFMSLANRSPGLSDEVLLNCFLSWLNVDIKRDVMALSPISLLRAVALGKLYEDKYGLVTKPSFNKPMVSTYATKHVSQPPGNLPPLLPTPSISQLKNNNVKRITPAEMQLRRDKGLCYFCDEKFTFNHKCINRQHLFLQLEEEAVNDHKFVTDPEKIDKCKEHHLSLNALKGGMSVGTIRFLAHINQIPVQVLIDGGSSDNFLQPRIAKFLKLPVEPASLFRVMVGNGNYMTAEGKIQQLKVQVHGHSFVLPIFLLPISGADLILRASWLKTIGPHMADYDALQLKILHEGKFITLQGDRELLLEENLHFGTLLEAQVEMEPKLALLLQTYSSVFDTPHNLPAQRSHDHSILEGSNPVKVKPYRYPHSQKEEIEKLVEGMINDGIIQHNKSPFYSLIILVKKKDGSWRFCTEYRALNAITIKDSFPIPTVDELIDELFGACYFSKFDLRSGYHQILLKLEDRHKTTFRTHHGHYEWLVMPFGLTNAPTSFQSLMNKIFHGLLRKFVLCKFGVTQIEYLRHILSGSGVAIDDTKLVAVHDIAAPLTDLLKKDAFRRTEQATTAFEKLKWAMTSTPVLALPNFKDSFVLETDASRMAIGSVLSQNAHPIAYFSKKMSNRMQKQSAYVRELYAITEALAKFRHYLLGHHFIIKTDQKSLKQLLDQTLQTPEQQQWLPKLLGCDFEIHYKAGKENIPADALSRSFFMAWSEPNCVWLQQLVQLTQTDQKLSQLYSQCLHSQVSNSKYSIKEGILFWKGRIMVPHNSTLINQILQEFHTSKIGGHAGIMKISSRIVNQFYWPNMQQDIRKFINECVVCQQAKVDHVLPKGLLQPFPIPQQVVKIHGIPKSIVSDRDKVFISSFWQHLFKSQGTTLVMGSAYHPQFDGQTESLNKTLEIMPWAQYWYNTSFHHSLGMTPFQAVFGRLPPTLTRYEINQKDPISVREALTARDNILSQLKANLVKSQHYMKQQADKKRRDIQLQVGDLALVKLQPYRQQSLALRKNQKLGLKFFGPFEVKGRKEIDCTFNTSKDQVMRENPCTRKTVRRSTRQRRRSGYLEDYA
ncbi:hypothetical protein V8G54_012275 [Vigna mungo]|uniref:Integrase catalytic domain-containing protein n=1 Tax=Vigna mungo TaxID=3915 RepID=A0AAQ3S0F3_VIGMU